MRFTQPFWAGLADGSVTVAFRRWRTPSAKAGGTQLVPGGLLAIDSVLAIDESDLTDEDARRAGLGDVAGVLASLRDIGADGTLYRVEFHYAGPDPRIALRAHDALSDDDVDELDRRLARLDRASPRGAWTRQILELIEARPEVRAPDVAESIGRDRETFKLDVRKLKALGLTESLGIGYRISPRGAAYLAAVRRR